MRVKWSHSEWRWEWAGPRMRWSQSEWRWEWDHPRARWFSMICHESVVFTTSLQCLRDVSHENIIIIHFTVSTPSFWGKSRTKASFSHLRFSVFEGILARKCRFQFEQNRTRELRFHTFTFLPDFKGSFARELRFHKLYKVAGHLRQDCGNEFSLWFVFLSFWRLSLSFQNSPHI